LAAGLTLVAAACGASNSTGTGGSTSASKIADAKAAAEAAQNTPTKILQTSALPSKPATGKSIVFISNGLPSTNQINAGVHEAADAVGWSYSTLSYSAADPATLQAALMNALAKHPTFVTEAGTSPDVFGAGTIAAYESAGVPIIVGSVFPLTQTKTILGAPNGGAASRLTGKLVADWFISDSNGTGHALLETATAFPVLTEYVKAFQDEVSAVCPGCSTKTVEISASQVSQGKLVPTVVAQLQANRDLTYVFFDNAQFSGGIVAALSAAGLPNVKIGGRSIDAASAAAVKAGTEQAWTGTSYYYEGYAIIDVAARHLANVSGAAADEAQPVQLMTSKNIDQYKGIYAQPADSLAQFEKLWKVPTTQCKYTCG
jgi:ribose transport system substrate-binding protein